MCLFIVNKKEKEIQKKRNIKSRKIDKRKRKMLVSKAFHNNNPVLRILPSPFVPNNISFFLKPNSWTYVVKFAIREEVLQRNLNISMTTWLRNVLCEC